MHPFIPPWLPIAVLIAKAKKSCFLIFPYNSCYSFHLSTINSELYVSFYSNSKGQYMLRSRWLIYVTTNITQCNPTAPDILHTNVSLKFHVVRPLVVDTTPHDRLRTAGYMDHGNRHIQKQGSSSRAECWLSLEWWGIYETVSGFLHCCR